MGCAQGQRKEDTAGLLCIAVASLENNVEDSEGGQERAGTTDFIAPQSTGNEVKQAEISQDIEGSKRS